MDTIEIYSSKESKTEKLKSNYSSRPDTQTTTYHCFKISPAVPGVGSNLKLISRELTLLGDSSDKDRIIPFTIHDGKVASVTHYGKQFYRLRTKDEFAYKTDIQYQRNYDYLDD